MVSRRNAAELNTTTLVRFATEGNDGPVSGQHAPRVVWTAPPQEAASSRGPCPQNPRIYRSMAAGTPMLHRWLRCRRPQCGESQGVWGTGPPGCPGPSPRPRTRSLGTALSRQRAASRSHPPPRHQTIEAATNLRRSPTTTRAGRPASRHTTTKPGKQRGRVRSTHVPLRPLRPAPPEKPPAVPAVHPSAR